MIRFPIRFFLALVIALTGVSVIAGVPASPAGTNSEAATVIVVLGAGGEDEYGQLFHEWGKKWEAAAQKGGARFVGIGFDESSKQSDLERLKAALEQEPKESIEPLWLVLLGHGTFDGKEAKFNLRGPDLASTDLRSFLQPFRRSVALINTASASGAFLPALSQEGRVIVTATKSGYELNFARFGKYLSDAITDPDADLDRDGQTSLLEAYLIASRLTEEFYKAESRLSTEHSLLDDNGDQLGTPADWFRGIRAIKKASDGAETDGLRAHQFHLVRSAQELQLPPELRSKRDDLELAVARLRDKKEKMPEDDYYRELETYLLQLAHLYESNPKPEDEGHRYF